MSSLLSKLINLAGNITGTLPIANGGTGATSQQAAMDALAGTQSAGKYLRSDGSHTTLTTLQAGDLPVATATAFGAVKYLAEDDSAGDWGTPAAVNVTTSETSFRSTTITTAGKYLVIACATVNNGQSNTSSDRAVGMTVYLNSTLKMTQNQEVVAASGTSYASFCAARVIDCAASDTISLKLAASANSVIQKIYADLVVMMLPKVS